MDKIFPKKLKEGDVVRVISLSESLALVEHEKREIANSWFEELGLKIEFGENSEEIDDFGSSSIRSRVEDLHNAFLDPGVKAIIAAKGGFNSNQLLKYIDWDIIQSHPKILCGYSDITALNNAIFAKTGLVNYSGPTYSSFYKIKHMEYTLEYFKKCLMGNDAIEILPSNNWSELGEGNGDWLEHINDGLQVINEGNTSGTILGGNLGTFMLLAGTEFFPDLENAVLFLEDICTSNSIDFPKEFERNLVSLTQQKGFHKVKGIVFGRFQGISGINIGVLRKILDTKAELKNIPVIANVDFGHTLPMITFPVGGEVKIDSLSMQIIKN